MIYIYRQAVYTTVHTEFQAENGISRLYTKLAQSKRALQYCALEYCALEKNGFSLNTTRLRSHKYSYTGDS